MAATKRRPAGEALKKPASLLESTEEVVATSSSKTSKEDVTLKRQTYYIEPEMIKAIGLKAVLEGRDKSDIVRSALDAYIEKKYFEIK